MGSLACLRAKRALVSLLRSMAARYGVELACNRDSPDRDVLAAFRKVALKAHPDRGGSDVDQQRLSDVRASWDALRKKAKPGRPAGRQAPTSAASAAIGDEAVLIACMECAPECLGGAHPIGRIIASGYARSFQG